MSFKSTLIAIATILILGIVTTFSLYSKSQNTNLETVSVSSISEKSSLISSVIIISSLESSKSEVEQITSIMPSKSILEYLIEKTGYEEKGKCIYPECSPAIRDIIYGYVKFEANESDVVSLIDTLGRETPNKKSSGVEIVTPKYGFKLFSDKSKIDIAIEYDKTDDIKSKLTSKQKVIKKDISFEDWRKNNLAYQTKDCYRRAYCIYNKAEKEIFKKSD
jgi:hypothetical protein